MLISIIRGSRDTCYKLWLQLFLTVIRNEIISSIIIFARGKPSRRQSLYADERFQIKLYRQHRPWR